MLQLKPKLAGSRAQWLVEKSYSFGAEFDNNFVIHDKSIHAKHAVLEIDGDQLTLRNLAGGQAVSVNGEIVENEISLHAGDEICIGESLFSLEDPKQNRATATPDPSTKKNEAKWTLKAQNTALANKIYALEGAKIIGRASECDICLKVVHLSRKHARLTLKDDHVQIEDLKSSNGTYLNGNKIEKAIAKSGDEIAFDTLRFTLKGPEEHSNATQIRPVADADATSMRPALSEAQLAQLKPKQAHSHKKAHPAPASAHPEKATTKSFNAVDTNSRSGSGGLAFVITACVIGLGIAAYLYFA